MSQMFLRVGILNAVAAVLVDVSALRQVSDGFPVADFKGAVCAVLKCQRTSAGKFLLRVNAQDIGEKIVDGAVALRTRARARLRPDRSCVCVRRFEARPQFEFWIGYKRRAGCREITS